MKLFSKIALASFMIASAIHPVHAAYNSAGTDYTNFVTNSWIDTGPAGDALSMVDFLLCVMEETKVATNVNVTYSVLVDENICFGEKATIPLYAHQTVTTLRAKATDPYTMKNWFVTGTGMKVVASTTITSGITTANPMGVFSMTWAAVSPTQAVGSKGKLDFALDGTMSYLENMTQDGGSSNAFSFVHGTMNASTDSGQMRMQAQDYTGGSPVNRVYQYVYDASHAHYKGNGIAAVCMDRTTSPKRVFGYQLFTEAGAKKALTGPFGFTYTVSSVEYNGWAHPNGAWLEKSHASGAFDKPTQVNRRSDDQLFNICYDDDWSVNSGNNYNNGYDDNVAGLSTVCGTNTAGSPVINLTYATDNAADSKVTGNAYVFSPALSFNAVSFTDTNDGASRTVSGGRYDGPGGSMDLGWQCIQAGASWINEARSSGVSNCDGAYNWRPRYSVPDGTQFVDSTDSTTYRVKAMDSMTQLTAVAAGTYCTDIPLANAPAAAGYDKDDIPAVVGVTWAALPTVTAANTIKYIHGVLQDK